MVMSQPALRQPTRNLSRMRGPLSSRPTHYTHALAESLNAVSSVRPVRTATRLNAASSRVIAGCVMKLTGQAMRLGASGRIWRYSRSGRQD